MKSISINKSLDNLLFSGEYAQITNNIPKYRELSYPVKEGGILEVIIDGFGIQRYTTFSNNVYTRVYTSSKWGPWKSEKDLIMGNRVNVFEYVKNMLNKKNQNFIFLGDSLTFGTGGGITEKITDDLRQTKEYTRVEKPLGQVIVETINNNRKMENTFQICAWPSDRIKQIYYRWNISKYSADIAVIMTGTNDAISQTPIGEYIKYLELTIENCIVNDMAVVLFSAPAPMDSNSVSFIKLYNDITKAVALKYECPFVDNIIQTRSFTKDMYDDLLHFNQNGYNKWGNELAPKFFENNLISKKEYKVGDDINFFADDFNSKQLSFIDNKLLIKAKSNVNIGIYFNGNFGKILVNKKVTIIKNTISTGWNNLEIQNNTLEDIQIEKLVIT